VIGGNNCGGSGRVGDHSADDFLHRSLGACEAVPTNFKWKWLEREWLECHWLVDPRSRRGGREDVGTVRTDVFSTNHP
jgi:hypothetical protein